MTIARPAGALTRLPTAAQTNLVELTASRTTIDLAGKTVETWAYNGAVPGPLLRVRAGETVRARVTNQLDDETTVHWHGIALANAMDGVPGVTQPPIAKGASFDSPKLSPSQIRAALRLLGPAGLRPLRPPAEEARLRGRRHGRERDASAIAHHYDVSNAFYRTVLGPSLTYSCAVWEDATTTLEEAQAAKHG